MLAIPFESLGYIAWPFIFVVVFVLGAVALPFYLLALRAQLARWWTAMSAGIVTALMTWAAMAATQSIFALDYALSFLAWSVVAGAAGGLTFWWAVPKHEQP